MSMEIRDAGGATWGRRLGASIGDGVADGNGSANRAATATRGWENDAVLASRSSVGL